MGVLQRAKSYIQFIVTFKKNALKRIEREQMDNNESEKHPRKQFIVTKYNEYVL